MDTMSTRQLTLLESIVVAGRIAVAELARYAKMYILKVLMMTVHFLILCITLKML